MLLFGKVAWGDTHQLQQPFKDGRGMGRAAGEIENHNRKEKKSGQGIQHQLKIPPGHGPGQMQDKRGSPAKNKVYGPAGSRQAAEQSGQGPESETNPAATVNEGNQTANKWQQNKQYQR